MLYYKQICHGIKPTHGWLNSTLHDTPLISEDELLEQDFIDDEELSDDVYESNDDDSNDDECS